MKRYEQQKGFTLVELLIAMGVLGLIMALVTGSYFGASRATRRTEERLELLSMGRIALDKIISEINGAYLDPQDATLYPFVGEPGGGWQNPRDELNFFTTSFDPRPLGAGSNFSEIGYYLEENPKLKTMFLQHRMDPFPDLDPGEGGIVTDLAEQVMGLNFRYQDEDETWSSRWDSTLDGKLPRIVEITIILEGMGGQTVQLMGMAAPIRWTPPET